MREKRIDKYENAYAQAVTIENSREGKKANLLL